MNLAIIGEPKTSRPWPLMAAAWHGPLTRITTAPPGRFGLRDMRHGAVISCEEVNAQLRALLADPSLDQVPHPPRRPHR
jgi:hypothetical protein